MVAHTGCFADGGSVPKHLKNGRQPLVVGCFPDDLMKKLIAGLVQRLVHCLATGSHLLIACLQAVCVDPVPNGPDDGFTLQEDPQFEMVLNELA